MLLLLYLLMHVDESEEQSSVVLAQANKTRRKALKNHALNMNEYEWVNEWCEYGQGEFQLIVNKMKATRWKDR